MSGVYFSVRRFALIAAAASAAMAIAVSTARALDGRELAGWWIAIDNTFPKLWAQRAIAPAEEILFINPDGRVQDRVMNFWAGSAQICSENKVCSDLPLIGVARLQIAGDRIAFVNFAASKDRLDIETGDAAIRREAIAATHDWTLAAEKDRITLRSSNASKVRVLVRVDPDRLRKIYAGMRASNWEPARYWRCYLGNATARDAAFAPLRNGRSYSPPEFLERYLNFASYIVALKSTIEMPAIDENDSKRRALLSPGTHEMMVQHFDEILVPPSVDERVQLQAVLSYIDSHVRALLASRATAASAAQAKARTESAAREAAKLADVTKNAAAAASAAQARASSAAAGLAKSQAADSAHAQEARNAATAAQDAETAAAASRQTADAAAAQQQQSAKMAAAAREMASALAAMQKAADEADAIMRRTKDAARAIADGTATGSAAPQAPRHVSADATHAAVAASTAALQAALKAAAAAREKADAEAEAAVQTMARLASIAEDAAKAAAAARDQAKSNAASAAQEAMKLASAARAAAAAASAAQDGAKSAAAAHDRAKAESDAAAQLAANAAAAASQAANAATTAQNALKAAAAAQPKTERLRAIAFADIAALAHVVGESEEAKQLFCRDEQPTPAALTPAAIKPAAAPSAAKLPAVELPAAAEISPAPVANQATVTVPLPLARPANRK